jgi:hypothetical protein
MTQFNLISFAAALFRPAIWEFCGFLHAADQGQKTEGRVDVFRVMGTSIPY